LVLSVTGTTRRYGQEQDQSSRLQESNHGSPRKSGRGYAPVASSDTSFFTNGHLRASGGERVPTGGRGGPAADAARADPVPPFGGRGEPLDRFVSRSLGKRLSTPRALGESGLAWSFGSSFAGRCVRANLDQDRGLAEQLLSSDGEGRSRLPSRIRNAHDSFAAGA
jgi:hypothetical protein